MTKEYWSAYLRFFLWFVPIVLVVLAILITLDIHIANKANEELLKTSAHFEERYAEVELDFEGPKKQGCKITEIYLWNAYQTCFVGKTIGHYPDVKIQGFKFVYHRPMPLFLGYRKTSDSLYFQEAVLGRRLKYIGSGGTVARY